GRLSHAKGSAFLGRRLPDPAYSESPATEPEGYALKSVPPPFETAAPKPPRRRQPPCRPDSTGRPSATPARRPPAAVGHGARPGGARASMARVDDVSGIRRILLQSRTIAVIGLSGNWYRPSF